jgi:hypothetical protein
VNHRLRLMGSCAECYCRMHESEAIQLIDKYLVHAHHLLKTHSRTHRFLPLQEEQYSSRNENSRFYESQKTECVLQG